MCLKWFKSKPKPKPPVPPVTPPAEPPPALPPKSKNPLWVFVPELMVARGDVGAFLKKVRAAGAWGVRFFLLQSWSTERLVPWQSAEFGGEPVRIVIPEEHLDTPVTDMGRINQAYWDRLHEILILLKENDLEAVCTLGDNCSQNTHTQTLSYPFFASIQMIPGEILPYIVPQSAVSICTQAFDGLYGKDKYEAHRQWVSAAVDNIRASGCAFRVEPQNEFARRGWTDDHPLTWYQMLVDALATKGVDGGQLIHSGDYLIEKTMPGTWSCHGVVKPQPPTFDIDPGRLMFSGDGGFGGNSETDVDGAGRVGLGVEDARALARYIIDGGFVGYEQMPRLLWLDDDCLANVDYFDPAVIEAMTKVFNS